MKQLFWHHVLIVSVAVVVLFTNLGGPRLWDRDEPRNASCAREMMERGDWVVPFENDRRRDAKPVLLYWLIMAAHSVFGVSEFAARFWSALLGIGTVLAVYHIGRRLFNARAALWGALILSTSLMFGIAARAATPDSLLIFCSTMALLVYVLGTFKRREAGDDEISATPLKTPGHYYPQSWPMLAMMFAMMGLGVLAKGPVGLVVPTAVIGMFLLIQRLPQRDTAGTEKFTWRQRLLDILRPFAPLHFLRTCWYMKPLLAIGIVLLIAGPWYVWVGLRTDGEYLRGFFLREHFHRATTTMENHSGPPFYYLAAILIGFFPWSVLTGATLIGLVGRIRRRDPWSVGYTLLACWVGVYVGIFTLATTKLPSYVTPCYPALALLTGGFVYHWTRNRALASRLWPRLSMASLALVGVAMLVGIPIFARDYHLRGDQWLGAAGLIPLAAAIIGFVLMESNRRRAAGVTLAVSAMVLATFMFGFATQRIDRHQQSHILFETIDRHSENPQLGSFRCLESTWVYYTKRPIEELLLKRELNPDAPKVDRNSPTRPWQSKPQIDVGTFFAASDEAFLITTRRQLALLKDELPAGVSVLAEVPYFLKRDLYGDALLLLGREKNAPQTANRSGSTTRQR